MAAFKLYRLPDFVEWADGLPSLIRSEIGSRLDRLRERSDWGPSKPVGGGVIELIIDLGLGYRIYVKPYKTTTILVLNGGDKTTQRADIRRAKAIAKAWN